MNLKDNHKDLFFLSFLFIVLVILKLYIAISADGFKLDLQLYKDWAADFIQYGFKVYPNNPEIDYPPLYMMILSPFVFILNQFEFLGNVGFANLFLKAPPIIMDFFCGLLLYKFCYKYTQNRLQSILLAIIYIIHPAVVVNSSA